MPTSTTPSSPFAIFGAGFRLIGRFVRARPVPFALAVTGAAIFASGVVLGAVVVGNLTDSVIVPVLDRGERIGNRLLVGLALIVGVSVWKAAGIVLRRSSAGWFQSNSQADVRTRLIEHQLDLRLSWFAKRTTGDLLSVTQSDALQGTGILAPLPYGTGVSLLLVTTVVLVFSIDWVLGLLTLAALAVYLYIDILGAWRIFLQIEDIQKLQGRVSSVAHESFDGALTVKALGREAEETARFGRAVDAHRERLVAIGRLIGSFRTAVDAIPSVSMILVLVVGAIRIRQGFLSAGDLVTITYLLSLLSVPIRLIGYVTWDLASSLAGWQRVQEVLDADDRVGYGPLTAVAEPHGADVHGEEVAFSYDGAEEVLRDVRFRIPPGQTVAVVGPTGSGKSTIALLLARLWDPASGSITIDGRDLRNFARSELPTEVAYVGQSPFLFDDTVAANIALGGRIAFDEIRAAASLAGADGFIARLSAGFDTRVGERGTTLSGGQQQRVALARALARRPRLLVLDDATSAVDPSVEAEILRGLREAELPSTVVMVAYRPASIVLADQVVYVEKGRVVGQGTHQELLESVPGYARLVRAYEEDAAARAGGG